MNTYGYVYGNPVNVIDPLGLGGEDDEEESVEGFFPPLVDDSAEIAREQEQARRRAQFEELKAKAAEKSCRGYDPREGTRKILEGIPENWKIRPTKGPGGVWFYDPNNKGNAVRVMPGDPSSPFANSQEPYVRWQRNGQPLDVNGNVLQSKYSPEAHIPLQEFRFNPEVYK